MQWAWRQSNEICTSSGERGRGERNDAERSVYLLDKVRYAFNIWSFRSERRCHRCLLLWQGDTHMSHFQSLKIKRQMSLMLTHTHLHWRHIRKGQLVTNGLWAPTLVRWPTLLCLLHEEDMERKQTVKASGAPEPNFTPFNLPWSPRIRRPFKSQSCQYQEAKRAYVLEGTISDGLQVKLAVRLWPPTNYLPHNHWLHHRTYLQSN